MSTKSDTKEASGFRFGIATFLILGVASTLAQYSAAAMFGISAFLVGGAVSSGGAIAIIAGIVMWVKCRSWDAWKKWIWLPVGVVVIIAFFVMGSAAQAIADQKAVILRQEQLLQEEAEQFAACNAMQVELDALYIELHPGPAVFREGEYVPSWVTPGEPRHVWGQAAKEKEYDQLLAKYGAQC